MSRTNPTEKKSPGFACPTCGTRFSMEQTKVPPFCSERCQMVDLGRWLNEEISVPFENEPDPTLDESGDF